MECLGRGEFSRGGALEGGSFGGGELWRGGSFGGGENASHLFH
jgi:hypothetical protein